MARIPFARHLPLSKIKYQYRSCRHVIEKSRWHALWLLARTDVPRTPAAVADVVRLSAVTVRHVLHRWYAHGPEDLGERRAGNGSEPKLTTRRWDALYAALQKRPPDGGVWTGPKVARYVRDRWAVSVGPVIGRRWLRVLGFTLQVPRPTHPKAADRPRRRAWKKLAAAGETTEGGPPRPSRRDLDRRRGPAGAQAGRPPGVVAQGVPADVVRADQVRVAVRLRPAEDYSGP